jgi:flagellin
MNMKEPGYDVKYFGVGAPAVSSVKYLSGNVRTTFALTNANTPSTTSAETATVYANNSAGKTSSSFGTEISNASHADLFDMYKAAYSAGDIIKDSGYVVIEFLESIAISAGGSFGQQKAYATFYNAASGNPVFSNEFDLVSGANTIEVGGNRFTLNVDTIDDRAYTAGSKLGITLQKGGIAANNWVELSDYGNTEYLSVAVDISTHNPGKFFVYALGYFSAGATSGMVELAGFEFDTHAALPTGVNISINVNPYNIAKENTRLADISLFTNGDGRMILANNQELQIYGNGNRTSIYLDGYDTIASLRDKLTSAIIDLGMGANAINNNLVKYFSSATSTTGGNGGVPGTFIIQTALLGANSELHFAGDEHLVNAMSLLTVQSSAQSQTSVSVFDAHSGRYIGSGAVYDNMLRGVIKGVDVKINSQTGYNAKWNYTNNQVSFSSIGKPQSVWLNLTDNQAEVQVGSNEGQKVNISVVRIDTAALEIDDVNVVTMPLAAKAIAKIDMALDRVSFERTDLGAKVNRLEYAMKNLSSSKINLIEAESRIRNVDIASESATFARNQILMDASIAMLAQANAIPYKALQLIRG